MQVNRSLIPMVVLVLALAACTSPEDRATAYLKNAQALYDKGDYKKAKIEARNAAQIQPKNAKARYLLALIAEHDQEFREMVGNLTAAVDADPKMVVARVKLGTIYFLGQVYDQAATEAKAASALAPDDPDVRVLNARLAFQRKDMEAGLKELDVALAKQPDHVEALVLQATAIAVTDPDKGLALLDSGIKRLDLAKAKSLRQMRIAILASQKKLGEVEEGYRGLIRDYPKENQYQYGLAQFYAGQGRVDDAEKVLRAVIALDPTDVQARLGLTQFLLQARDAGAAERTLEAFVAESPNALPLRLALARLYETDKKPDQALKTYMDLAKKDPKSTEGITARVRLGALKIGQKKMDEGRAEIEAVLKDAPDNADALLIRAGLRVIDKQYNEAVADVRTVLRKEPKNGRALLLQARTHMLMGERMLAKDAYRRLIDVDPRNAEGPIELAKLEGEDGNPQAGEAILRKRLEVDSKDWAAMGGLVDQLMAQKNFSQAEETARHMITVNDEKGIAHYELARALQAQNKSADALAAFDRALEKSPEWNLPLEGKVITLANAGKTGEAISYLNDYLKKYPASLSAKFLLGGMKIRSGDVAAGRKIFDDIVAAKPDARVVWMTMAGIPGTTDQQRIEVYQRALKAMPGDAEVAMVLGNQYEAAGRFDEAISHYDSTLKAYPKLDLIANNLASLLLDYRTDAASHAKALELVKRFDKATNPFLLDTLGWAYYRNGDYANAVPYLERGVAAAGDAPVLRYHLGMAYLAAKNNAGAKQELTKAVENVKGKYPGIDEARATLKRLGGKG